MMLQSILSNINKWFRYQALSEEEKFLSGAKDLIELEYRQRLIKYQQAPWQIKERHWSQFHK
tara:strand:+ start:257 stop:442 length:186 start_codon:yes stop_codon:yes gene_type:complete